MGKGKRMSAADRLVLADVVRYTQKQSLKGSDGGWKDYLARHDKKLGSGVGDPAKRPHELLLSFLRTFPPHLQKYFEMVIKRSEDRKILLLSNDSHPHMSLVSLTERHPEYARNYVLPSYKEGWEFIKLRKTLENVDATSLIAIRCHTVLCTDGSEALVRICAVDQKLEVILDRLVNPNKPVKNYRTTVTGLSAEDLDGVTCLLSDVQKSLKQIFKKGTILVGYRLFNDLQALQVDYPLVIDTASIFSYSNLPTRQAPSLNSLCMAVLGETVPKEIIRNCIEEAKAAMKLVTAKLERGFDNPISVSSGSVSDHSKVLALPELGSKDLLVHHVPITVPYLELTNIFPGTPEIDDHVKVQGDFYSTFVKYKDANEADNAYGELIGKATQDSARRPQKEIVLKRQNGEQVKISVRKVLKRKLLEDTNEFAEETKDNLKKLKMSHDGCTPEKEALVEIVRKIQRMGLKGSKGNWKEFLTIHDKQFGTSIADPARREEETLTSFLSTFSPHLQKYFDKMKKRKIRLRALEEHISKFPESESSELRLVRMTADNLDYRRNYDFPSYNEDWKVMKVGSVSNITESKSKSIVAIDCEMVLCEDGSEAAVRVSAVNQDLNVLIDKLICPGKTVKDYRTHITDISAEDLDGVTCTLANIQKSLRKILKKGTILVGHSLFFDLRALKIDYPLVIDTTCIFKHADLPYGVSPSLNNLCKAVLGRAVRGENETHDCLNDAKATMELVLAKLKGNFDHPINVSFVSESDLAKLKVHKVPIKVSCEELGSLLPGNPKIDKDVRVSGNVYATLVEFGNAKDAETTFQNLDGDLTKDLCGRPQKRVRLKLGNGEMVTFNIRKMFSC